MTVTDNGDFGGPKLGDKSQESRRSEIGTRLADHVPETLASAKRLWNFQFSQSPYPANPGFGRKAVLHGNCS
jgi:hypothetical protein